MDADGDTALMESLFFDRGDALELLLEAGADYIKNDSYGDSILHDVARFSKALTSMRLTKPAKQRLNAHSSERPSQQDSSKHFRGLLDSISSQVKDETDNFFDAVEEQGT